MHWRGKGCRGRAHRLHFRGLVLEAAGTGNVHVSADICATIPIPIPVDGAGSRSVALLQTLRMRMRMSLRRQRMHMRRRRDGRRARPSRRFRGRLMMLGASSGRAGWRGVSESQRRSGRGDDDTRRGRPAHLAFSGRAILVQRFGKSTLEAANALFLG